MISMLDERDKVRGLLCIESTIDSISVWDKHLSKLNPEGKITEWMRHGVKAKRKDRGD